MTESHRRGVTRGYVGGLIFAVAIFALSLLIAAWGGLSLAIGSGPVATQGVSLAVAPLIVLAALIALAWGLWRQSLLLLRGRRSPSWAHTVVIGFGGYLIWCLGGLLTGLGLRETWLSLFAVLLGVIWALSSLLCWAVLVRRVYTDRPIPQWPWEKRGEPGPDWIGGDNPWTGPPAGDGDRDDGRDGDWGEDSREGER